MLLTESLIEGDILLDNTGDGLNILRSSLHRLQPSDMRSIKQHAISPLSNWPINARVSFACNIDSIDTSPYRVLMLAELPTTAEEMKTLCMEDRTCVLAFALKRARYEAEPSKHDWLTCAQVLAGDELQAWAMQYWLEQTRFDGGSEWRLRKWLNAVEYRGVSPERYCEIVKLNLRSQEKALSDDWFDIRMLDIGYGLGAEDYYVETKVHRPIGVYELHRFPGSWPEHACLPSTILGGPTENDLERGRWMLTRAFSISGRHRITAGCENDIIVSLCVHNQDDHSPGVLTPSKLVAQPTTRLRRSRSQPELHVCYDERAALVAEFYENFARQRLRRSPHSLWRTQGPQGDPSLSAFHGIRCNWQRHLQGLLYELGSVPYARFRNVTERRAALDRSY